MAFTQPVPRLFAHTFSLTVSLGAAIKGRQIREALEPLCQEIGRPQSFPGQEWDGSADANSNNNSDETHYDLLLVATPKGYRLFINTGGSAREALFEAAVRKTIERLNHYVTTPAVGVLSNLDALGAQMTDGGLLDYREHIPCGGTMEDRIQAMIEKETLFFRKTPLLRVIRQELLDNMHVPDPVTTSHELFDKIEEVMEEVRGHWQREVALIIAKASLKMAKDDLSWQVSPDPQAGESGPR